MDDKSQKIIDGAMELVRDKGYVATVPQGNSLNKMIVESKKK